MRARWSCGLLGCILGLFCGRMPGSTPAAEDTPPPSSRNERLVFFLIVNETDQNVRVRVLADDSELFVQEVSSRRVSAGGAQEAPPSIGPPARERKETVSTATRRLTVEELITTRSEDFDVLGFGEFDAGFRIMVREEEISLAQDYFPVR